MLSKLATYPSIFASRNIDLRPLDAPEVNDFGLKTTNAEIPPLDKIGGTPNNHLPELVAES
jgi:hypothetical protein